MVANNEMQETNAKLWTVTQIRRDLGPTNASVDIFAAKIQPKDANTLIRKLNICAPLQSLGHVKRVRKRIREDGVELSIILCLVSNANTEWCSGAIPPEISQLVEEYSLKPFIAAVPKNEASSREEWEEQSEVWPTSYHPNAANVHQLAINFSYDEESKICRFMQAAIKQSQLAANAGQFSNGAIVVDPSTDEIISSGHDETGRWIATVSPSHRVENDSYRKDVRVWHPLRHAVMVAIERASKWNTCEMRDEGPEYSSWNSKRPRINESNDSLESGGSANQQYLCTGFDAYIVREPCSMCAMALLHQRFRRVFYGIPNRSIGALGGSQMLHERKGLNHHYTVFRVSLNEEDIL